MKYRTAFFSASLSLLFLLSLITSCEETKAKTIYLFPEGFEGEVVITYDVEDGQKATFEDGVRVVKIPEDGRVNTAHTASFGVADDQYYFVSENGDRTPLFFDFDTGKPHQFCIHGLVTSSRKINGNKHDVEAFLVTPKSKVDSLKGHTFDIN